VLLTLIIAFADASIVALTAAFILIVIKLPLPATTLDPAPTTAQSLPILIVDRLARIKWVLLCEKTLEGGVVPPEPLELVVHDVYKAGSPEVLR
jgi:hypothetical protein